MNEAQSILDEHLAQHARRPHAELCPLARRRHVETSEVSGAGGRHYRIELRYRLDRKGCSLVRIVGRIVDAQSRALISLARAERVVRPG